MLAFKPRSSKSFLQPERNSKQKLLEEYWSPDTPFWLEYGMVNQGHKFLQFLTWSQFKESHVPLEHSGIYDVKEPSGRS